MDLNNISLFSIVKKQLAWLTQRQEILTQNIANSDTPMYRPKDLRKFSFKDMIRRQSMQLNVTATLPGHLPGRRRRIRDFDTVVDRRPFETAPNGNAVVLEEQMVKMSETQISHKLTTDLYKKHLNMYRSAIGKGR